MIVDITGIELVPGNNGSDCPGNGFYLDGKSKNIDCCCDECDFFLCCLPEHNPKECEKCEMAACPRNKYCKK